MIKKLLLFITILPSLLLAQTTTNDIDYKLLILDQNLGLVLSDLKEIKITGSSTDKPTGVKHIYFNQYHQGIAIHNAILGLHLDKNSKVISVSNQFVSGLESRNTVAKPSLTAKAAAINALSFKLDPSAGITKEINLVPVNTNDGIQIFTSETLVRGQIKTELKWVVSEQTLKLSWNVNWLTLDSKNWYNIRIDANTGEVLDESNWVAECSVANHNHSENTVVAPSILGLGMGNGAGKNGAKYNVLAMPVESPSHGDRTLLNDPSDSLSSPYSWHDIDATDGHEFTITRGNNVYASEDKDNDNVAGYSPDGGSSLNFDFEFDKTKKHTDYLDAAITNLFYWNNLMHDVWYHYGFDDESGNFQYSNYNRGGEERDEVMAEAQDGSGTNNANFATPPDGENPRMQMYVWNVSASSFLLEVKQPSQIAKKYLAVTAGFGPKLSKTPINGNLVLADDGTSTPTFGCDNWINANDLAGEIALIDRGDCRFIEKVKIAQDLGAKAVIIIQNSTAAPFTMGGDGITTITIPSIMISKANGDQLKNALKTNAIVVSLYDSSSDAGKQYDSDFDNGIICHEYGHGISNRLTGGPANTDCLTNQEQMGEGWSDFFALVMTHKPTDKGEDKRGIGTYTIDQANDGDGIRNFPYSTSMTINPVTYKNIKTFSIPHGVGSVWCSMLWDMYWDMIARHGYDTDIYNGTGGNNMAMKLVIDGMKLQPCNPGFEDGRDAILLADEINNGGANQDLIWKAFARRGLGAGAKQGSSNSVQDGIESFDVPKFDLPTITKTASDEAKNKDTIIYKIVIKNTTKLTLKQLNFNDTLNASLSYSKAIGFTKSSIIGSVYSSRIDSIQAGDSVVGYIYAVANSNITSKVLELTDFENGINGWQAINLAGARGWQLSGIKKYKGNQCYFISNFNTESDNVIQKKLYLKSDSAFLAFYHYFNTESDWDGAVVEINTGAGWVDLGDKMIEQGYNGIISENPQSNISMRKAFTGSNKQFKRSVIDLSDYKNDTVQIRFRMVSDGASGAEGWYIDNIALYDNIQLIKNRAFVTNQKGGAVSSSTSTVILEREPGKIFKLGSYGFKILPNPFLNHITIETNHNNYDFELVDVLGKLLIEGSKMNRHHSINTENLPSGTYFLRIKTNEGIDVIKLVK